jgi:hypothetical protein
LRFYRNSHFFVLFSRNFHPTRHAVLCSFGLYFTNRFLDATLNGGAKRFQIPKFSPPSFHYYCSHHSAAACCSCPPKQRKLTYNGHYSRYTDPDTALGPLDDSLKWFLAKVELERVEIPMGARIANTSTRGMTQGSKRNRPVGLNGMWMDLFTQDDGTLAATFALLCAASTLGPAASFAMQIQRRANPETTRECCQHLLHYSETYK